MNQARPADADIVLIGAGIMSATLAVFLKELDPSLRIEIFEVLDGAALESSDAWNNAGTGHAALCELNYTPERSDGSIDISKALEVNVEFDLSRQLWTYLIRNKAIASPGLFIHAVPHMSFVHGAAHVAFLKKRHAALTPISFTRAWNTPRTNRLCRNGSHWSWRAAPTPTWSPRPA
jgi:malate dehydrogenase (quinone)